MSAGELSDNSLNTISTAMESSLGALQQFFQALFPLVEETIGPFVDPAIVVERLGDKFAPPFFERGVMKFSALSIPHFRLFMERSVGPMQKLVESLAAEPQSLERFRAELATVKAELDSARDAAPAQPAAATPEPVGAR